MNFEEFKEICNGTEISNKHNPKYANLTDCGISVSWTTGGVGGGSCWDTGKKDNHYYIEGEKEPEFYELDRILEKVCPGLTFIQYRSVCHDVVDRHHYSINEYYGNCTNFCEKWIDIQELYNALVKRGLLCSEK